MIYDWGLLLGLPAHPSIVAGAEKYQESFLGFLGSWFLAHIHFVWIPETLYPSYKLCSISGPSCFSVINGPLLP